MPYTIKERRKSKGYSQEDLRKLSGVPRQVISYLESGAQTNTTVDTLRKLAVALECKVSDIFLS